MQVDASPGIKWLPQPTTPTINAATIDVSVLQYQLKRVSHPSNRNSLLLHDRQGGSTSVCSPAGYPGTPAPSYTYIFCNPCNLKTKAIGGCSQRVCLKWSVPYVSCLSGLNCPLSVSLGLLSGSRLRSGGRSCEALLLLVLMLAAHLPVLAWNSLLC